MVQWNPFILDTLPLGGGGGGGKGGVKCLFRGVSSFQGLIKYIWDFIEVSSIQGSISIQGPRLEGFHCIVIAALSLEFRSSQTLYTYAR